MAVRYWITDLSEWLFAAYFIFAAALLPFALAGGVIYLARQLWGLE